MRSLLRFLMTIGVAGAVLAVAIVGLGPPWDTVTHGLWSAKPEPVGELAELSERSIVYSSSGEVLTTFQAEENRKPVALSDVPILVRQAILDVEDQTFYEHGGFDARSVARAFFTNASAGAVRQGGSTITQQLVKASLLTPERSFERKIKEAVLATRLEKQMTKDEILQRYLNLIYFGNGSYGVQAASETYFGIPVSQITDPAQAALLAGLIRNPLANDPLRNPEQALERRNTALQQMVDRGHISEQQGDQLKTEPLPVKLERPLPKKESYFIEAMKQRLLDDPRLGDTPTERYNAVFRGGLRIKTSFDTEMQRQAEEAARNGVPTGRANRLGAVAAMAVVEPATGHIKAIVGGPGYDDQHRYDIATQGRRQPGSTFKIFTLLASLEAGYGAGSTVDGSGPCQVRGERKAIDNAGDTIGGGSLTMAGATAGSVNCAFERMAATIGLDKVAEMAKRLGLKGKIELVPSMVIGSEEATPLEMAGAYASVANDGVYHQPTFIEEILDRSGKVLFKGTDEGKRLLSTTVARTAAEIMKGVFHGTAACCPLAGRRQAAGKTGTTNDSSNTWFVGYTPQLATAVWVGVPDANQSLRGLGGRGSVFGATFAAPIWRTFMNAALASQPVVDFQKVAPKDTIKSKPFRLPKGAFIIGTTATAAKPSVRAPSAPASGTGPSTTIKGGSTSKPPTSDTTGDPPTSKKTPTTTAP